MKSKSTIIIAALSIFLLAASAYAYRVVFENDHEAYQVGYQQGYNHGSMDRDDRMDFNFRRPSSSGMSYDTYSNMNYRSGYQEGYSDGFYSRGSRLDENSTVQGSTTEVLPDRSDRSYVLAFVGSDFLGSAVRFKIGTFPYLDAKWNDAFRSVEIHGSVRVIMFDEPNFGGRKVVLDQSTSNLSDLGFSQRVESLIVEPAD